MQPRDLDRFMRKFREEDKGYPTPCWVWQAYCERDGYGRFPIKMQPYPAHRVSYEHFVGPIPEGLEIDHMCCIRNCVNPDHLRAITHKLNSPGNTRREQVVIS